MVNKLKCVVVDDEPLAREVLTKYVEVVDYLELAATCENALELNQVLESEKIDIIFLDIEMPLMTGLDFLQLKSDLPIVILTTAFSNYALDGFQFDVMDYLLKPITFNRFFKAVSKANEYYNLKNNSQGQSKENIEEEPYFFIKCESKYEKIFANRILFVKSMQNYVLIHTDVGNYMTLLPLKTVEENLDSKEFIKVHKSYLVAISKIETMESHELLIESHRIPIGRSFRENVHERVLKNKVLKKD
ncbi:LytTR family DNA-binding domain-containing protein [uncultured Arcticibacterium sp.]|uniref:LytR/AlgR family response regulator transcription factor n=1 Tax=uncultured Arcticibacterium sp. TaxID=2173042 RepID=UPI0030FBFD15